MFMLISAILLGTGLYFHNDQMLSYFIASGLFAIASAIDRIDITIDASEEKEGDGK